MENSVTDKVRHNAPALLLAAASFCGILAVAANSTLELLAAMAAACCALFLFRNTANSAKVFLCVFALMAAWSLVLAPCKVSDFTPHSYGARINSVRCGEKSQQAVITIAQIDGAACSPFLVALTVTDVVPQLAAGDFVELKGELQPIDRYSNVPYMRMNMQNDRANRISARLVLMHDKVKITGTGKGLKYVFERFRSSLAAKIYAGRLSPAAARLLVASCLGTGDADVKAKERFRVSGLSHLLCISGFHVGVLAFVVSLLLFPLRLLPYRHRRVWRYLPPLAVVWFYALVVGFTPPVIRAAIMLSVYSFAKMAQRQPKPANTLCLAFVLVLLVNPYWLFSAGFQLSFSAVAGLLLFADKLNPVPRRHKTARGMAALFVVPLAAMLGTLPVMLVWFHRVPLLSIPVNAVASLVFPLFMVAGILAVMAGSGVAGTVLSGGVNGLYSLLEGGLDIVADSTAGICAEFYPGTASVIAIITAVAAAAYALHAKGFRHKLAAVALMLCAAMCIGIENTLESRNTWLLIDGDSRGSEISLLKAGSEPRPVPAEGMVEVGVLHIATLHSGSTPAATADANLLLLTRTFRGNLSEFLSASKVDIVVIGADLDYKRRRAYSLVCRQKGVSTYLLSNKAFCRIVQNK